MTSFYYACHVRLVRFTHALAVIGSDICTCRPYLIYGIQECVRQAQEGGVGVIVYCKCSKQCSYAKPDVEGAHTTPGGT